MTQSKSKKALKPSKSAINLQSKFLALPEREQMGVTTFFNCHNAAHFIYDSLSEDAKNYVNYCIRLSQQADKIEEKESAQVS